MTREEVISALHECAAKMGRVPLKEEFSKETGISVHQVVKNFGTFGRLLSASGMERQGTGAPLKVETLFLDWARVTRSLGKVPSKAEYGHQGKYSVAPYTRRFRAWANVAQAMQAFVIRHRPAGDWEDVRKIIEQHLAEAGSFPGSGSQGARLAVRDDRPLYGRPMFGNLNFVPTNEQGVLFVFGAVAEELGFFITHVQTEFPDVEALREIAPHLCQRQHWELEYESRNFLEHMHPIGGCDGIVCWINNWPDCPMEVIELRTIVERLAKDQKL